MKAIILAAGMGFRLGGELPKPLTPLLNEKTILDYQIEKLVRVVGLHHVMIVVGYKFYLLMERFPQLLYAYNREYAQTNTAKSLLCALSKVYDEDVLWMNGDIFFDEKIIGQMAGSKESICLVNNERCGDEEIKYTLNEQGSIRELSKQVRHGKGEALGINLVVKRDLELFKEELAKVGNGDYFEKALENLTLSGRLQMKPFSVDRLFCHEIDFPEDLEKVRKHLNQS